MSISITSSSVSAIAAAWWFQLMRTLIIPNRAQQKYALHMQSYTPARLPRAVREVEAVSWSQDQRIAVTSSDTVSIFTLKGRGSSASSLPASVSTASGLPCDPNPPTPPSTLYDPSSSTFDLSIYLDHTHVPGHTPSAIWESGWSPADCDVIGGCLLTVLTIGGQLWLLTPPGLQTMKWQISTCLNGPSGSNRYTTFHWLQQIIPAENGVGGVSLIAMATKKQIHVVAVRVPIYRDREPETQLVWEGEVKGDGWPCRLCWSHTPLPGSMAGLAVGLTGGQLEVLSWRLPTEWGGASEWAEPERSVVWEDGDGMAVRHVAWQHNPSQGAQPWLVFSKTSSLVAMQFPAVSSDNGPPHITIFGVHSRSVTGLASLPGNQFISCSLDSSVQTFSLGSCDGHVIPTPVVVSGIEGECRAQGLAVSDNALFCSILTSECKASLNYKQVSSQLHLFPLRPLSDLMTSVDLSWDVAEAIRQHAVAKKPLPGNFPLQLSSQWQYLLLILQSSECAGGEEVEGDDGAGVLMEHVLGVLGGSGIEGVVRGEGAELQGARMSLKIMCEWVESSRLAPPHQQQTARMVLEKLKNEMSEKCIICQTSIPFTNHRKETCANGHSWERCCVTLLLATSSLCGRCRGCGAVANNPLSLKTNTSGSWFNQLISQGRCTYCHSYFDLVI